MKSFDPVDAIDLPRFPWVKSVDGVAHHTGDPCENTCHLALSASAMPFEHLASAQSDPTLPLSSAIAFARHGFPQRPGGAPRAKVQCAYIECDSGWCLLLCARRHRRGRCKEASGRDRRVVQCSWRSRRPRRFAWSSFRCGPKMRALRKDSEFCQRSLGENTIIAVKNLVNSENSHTAGHHFPDVGTDCVGLSRGWAM